MATPRRGVLALAGFLASIALLLPGCGLMRRRDTEEEARRRVEEEWSTAVPTAVSRYDAAKKFHQRGRYREAVVAFQRWLTTYGRNPLEPAALYYLASSQYNMGMQGEAKNTCARLAREYPNTDWATFARHDVSGLKRVGAGEGPQHRWWNPADWFTPEPPLVREFDAARGLYKRRKFEQALATFRALAERNPDSPLAPAAWYYAARSYEYVAQLDKARETYQHVAATYPHTEWEWLAQEDLRRLRVD